MIFPLELHQWIAFCVYSSWFYDILQWMWLLKDWVFLFWEQFFFSGAYVPTHLTNTWVRDCVGPDPFKIPFCGKDIVLRLTPGCVCSLRRGDSALLGPGPACAVLRQFRSLRHHVGHRREKRDGHRAPGTQVRLWAAAPMESFTAGSWRGPAKAPPRPNFSLLS